MKEIFNARQNLFFNLYLAFFSDLSAKVSFYLLLIYVKKEKIDFFFNEKLSSIRNVLRIIFYQSFEKLQLEAVTRTKRSNESVGFRSVSRITAEPDATTPNVTCAKEACSRITVRRIKRDDC